MDRVHNEWIRLQPGDMIVVSKSLRGLFQGLKPGTVDYRAEYSPPEATPKELAELKRAGYIVPTEMIESAHKSFDLH
jgi:hypothetical protein